jgi:hypothetical protein
MFRERQRKATRRTLAGLRTPRPERKSGAGHGKKSQEFESLAAPD